MPGIGSNFKAAFFRRLRRATRLNYVGEGFPFQLTAVNIVLHAPIRTPYKYIPMYIYEYQQHLGDAAAQVFTSL